MSLGAFFVERIHLVFGVNAKEEISQTVNKEISTEELDVSGGAKAVVCEHDKSEHTANHTVNNPEVTVGHILVVHEAHDNREDARKEDVAAEENNAQPDELIRRQIWINSEQNTNRDEEFNQTERKWKAPVLTMMNAMNRVYNLGCAEKDQGKAHDRGQITHVGLYGKHHAETGD